MTTTVPSTASEPRDTDLLAAPNSPRKPVRSRGRANYERAAWLFMRLSGLLLVVLVLGHLFIMNILDDGVHRINWGFVAGRWASPFWQMWDLAMLWLAMLHGTNGLRVVIADYANRAQTRFWLTSLLYTASALVLFTGTLVIFTFDPTMS
jgi:succinate dehydrogenase / fumarate reductase, membrane anchor subunit